MASIFLHRVPLSLEDEFNNLVLNSDDPVWGIPRYLTGYPPIEGEYEKIKGGDFILFSRNGEVVGCGLVSDKPGPQEGSEYDQGDRLSQYYRLSMFSEESLPEQTVLSLFDFSTYEEYPQLFKIPENRIGERLEYAETPRELLNRIIGQIAEVGSQPPDPDGGNGGDGDGGGGGSDGGEGDSDNGNGREVLRQTASDIVQISILLTGIIIAAASTLEKTGQQNQVEFGVAMGFGGLLLLLSIPLAAHVIIRTSINPVRSPDVDQETKRNLWLSRFITGAVASAVGGVVLIAVDAGLQIGLGLVLVMRPTFYALGEALFVLVIFAVIYCRTYRPVSGPN
ncbi:hypothetical protein ABSL23_03550 [Halobacterium sp. NMX12-1]|uniref:Uncharacterized protein n=1 Tax=Halobacterium sp. NMX12-1 TaxID=3166650 RepID=A0AAU8CEC1_9EURY